MLHVYMGHELEEAMSCLSPKNLSVRWLYLHSHCTHKVARSAAGVEESNRDQESER